MRLFCTDVRLPTGTTPLSVQCNNHTPPPLPPVGPGPLCDATLSAASTNPSTLLYYEARGYKGARVTVTGTGFQAEPAVTRCIFYHGSSAAPTSAAQVEAGDYYVSKATFVSATEVVCQPRWGHSGPASFSVTTNMVDFAAASTSGFAAMPARATGTVMEEYYRYNGGSIDGFLASNLYPYAPDVTMTVTDRTTFGIPNEGATTPHVRIQSGYLQVPANGDYTFLIASLDEARLYLSTDASPANLAEIARNDAPTSNLTATAQQQSTPQTLVAGHTYAVAVIYRAANTLELQVGPIRACVCVCLICLTFLGLMLQRSTRQRERRSGGGLSTLPAGHCPVNRLYSLRLINDGRL